MGMADRRRQQLTELVQPSLEPGEHVQAALGTGQTGPSPWFGALTTLIYFWIRMLGVVVTDRRVFLVKRGSMTGRVKGIVETIPREQARVIEWKPAGLWSKLRLQLPSGELKLNVHRVFREDAEQVAQALGAAAPPSGMPQADTA